MRHWNKGTLSLAWHMNVQELDRELIHKLVKEIRVGMHTKVDGMKCQEFLKTNKNREMFPECCDIIGTI